MSELLISLRDKYEDPCRSTAIEAADEIERLTASAQQWEGAARQFSAERDRYKEALEELEAGSFEASTTREIAREALNPSAIRLAPDVPGGLSFTIPGEIHEEP